MKLKFSMIFSIVAVLLISYSVGLYYNLDVGQTPVKADIIIVNEGVYEYRSEKATELLNQGYADQILISPASSYALEWYYDLGVQEEQIVPEYEASSTWTNAVNSLEIVEENGWTSALVVTSDYHMRRVRLAYERAKEAINSDVHLTYVSAYPVENVKEIPYTEHSVNRSMALYEVFKYTGYLIGLYYFIDL